MRHAARVDANQMTITQSYLKELFDYREDGKLVRKATTSNRAKIGTIVGSNNGNGYLRVCVKSKYCHVHRIIFMWHYGYFPKEVDHKNGNRSDNRIENLREATHLQNGKNLSVRKNNKAGVNGVKWDSERNKWHASIRVNYKNIYLGRFVEVEDAIKARKIAEISFYKEWSREYA
jgi:hypothetical protein